MTIATKRSVERKQRRAERMSLLAEIDRLNKQRCADCIGNLGGNATTSDFNCGCTASVRILEIGKILEGDTRKPIRGLTVDEYKRLKSTNMTDVQIREQYDIPATTLQRWKKRNGITPNAAKEGMK